MLLWLLIQTRLWIHPAKDLIALTRCQYLFHHTTHSHPPKGPMPGSRWSDRGWLVCMLLRTSSATKPWQQPYGTAVSLGHLQAPFGTSVNLRLITLGLFSLFKISFFPLPPSPFFFSRYNALKWCEKCVTAYQANGCYMMIPRVCVSQALDLDLKACEKALQGRTVSLLLLQTTTGNRLEQSHPQKHNWISSQKELVDSFQKKLSGLNRETEMLSQRRYSHIPAGSQPRNLILLCKFNDAGTESFWYMKDRLLMYQRIRDFCFIRQTDNDVWIFLKTWRRWLGSTLKFHRGKLKLKIQTYEKSK